jgi:hypothetical protein
MAGLPPTRAQFVHHGPPAEVWEPLARRVVSLDVALDRFKLPSHGLTTDQQITFNSGPTLPPETSTLPDGLSEFVTYYARIISTDLFEVSLTPGGTAHNVGPGSGTASVEIMIDVGPNIDHHLAMASGEVLGCFAANDWDEPPGGWGSDVIKVVLDRAMWPCLDGLGYKPPDEERDGYKYRYIEAGKIKDAWCNGKNPPIGVVPDITPDPDTIDISSSIGSSGFGDEDRGYLGRADWTDRRRPTV